MKRTHRLVVANGEYTVEGETKTRWLTIGAMLQGDGKTKIKLDTMPLGEWDGWVQIFPIEEQQGHASSRPAGPPGSNTPAALDDDIPF